METAMQRLKWFMSDGLDDFDESTRLSEIWEKLDELIEQEKMQITEAYNAGDGEYSCIANAVNYYEENYKK